MQPTFQIGDKILLRHDSIPTMTPSRKLASKFLGPFPVTSKISNVIYCLKLPPTLRRIHDVFHVSLLEKYRQDTIMGQQQILPPPIITPDGDVEWEVHEVLDYWVFGRGKRLQYLVSWEGYGLEENLWELATSLENAPDVVEQFHRLHPKAPRPSFPISRPN